MWGFADKETAEALKKLVDPVKPSGKDVEILPGKKTPPLRAYLAHPAGAISGAIRIKSEDSDGNVLYRLQLGVGEVFIHQRDKEGQTERNWTMPRRYPSKYEPNVREIPVKRKAYNLCPEPIALVDGDGLNVGCPDTMLFCVEDILGDLYIVKVCEYECSSSSSSSSSSSGSSSSEGSNSSSSGSSSSEGSSSESESSESSRSSKGSSCSSRGSSCSSRGSEGSGSEGSESESCTCDDCKCGCHETGDVPFVSGIEMSGGTLIAQMGILKFKNGKFCGWEADHVQNINLCDLECGSSSSALESQTGSGSSEEECVIQFFKVLIHVHQEGGQEIGWDPVTGYTYSKPIDVDVVGWTTWGGGVDQYENPPFAGMGLEPSWNWTKAYPELADFVVPLGGIDTDGRLTASCVRVLGKKCFDIAHSGNQPDSHLVGEADERYYYGFFENRSYDGTLWGGNWLMTDANGKVVRFRYNEQGEPLPVE